MSSRRVPSGFTILEVVVALAIAGISLVGLLRLHLLSIRGADRAEFLATAGLVAEARLNEALADGVRGGSRSGTSPCGARSYRWDLSIADARPRAWASRAPLRRITVRVWPSAPAAATEPLVLSVYSAREVPQ